MKARWSALVASLLLVFAVACGGSDSKGGLLSGVSSSDKPAATAAPVSSASSAGQAFGGGDKDRSHAGGSSNTGSGDTGSDTKPTGPSSGTGASSGNKPGTSTNASALGDTFKPKDGSYSMQYPKDWTAQAGAASLGGTVIDGFISPDVIDGFAPNVNVLCDSTGGGMTLDAYVKANVAQFEKQKVTIKDAGKAPTAGADGRMVTYTTSFAGKQLDFTQVLLTDKRCGWVMTLTAPEGMRDKYLKTFLAMVATFKAAN